MTGGTLDVYRDWLGVEEEARPLNHYQILRLKRFEDDAAKVREHYRKLSASVRKHAGGDFGHKAEALLGELAEAVTCLTDPRRKQQYDNALGHASESVARPRSLEQILLGQGAVTQEQITKAEQFCRVVGVDLHEALVQQKAASMDVVTAAYAESLGVPFFDVTQAHLEDVLARQVPAVLARQHSCVPVLLDQNQLVVAAPRLLEPDVEEQLRLRSGKMIRFVIGSPSAINAQINQHYPRELVAKELAAGGPKLPSSAKADEKKKKKKAAAGKQSPEADAAPVEEEKPLTPEEAAKRRRELTIVTFNLTIMAMLIPYVSFFEWAWLGIFGGILVAGVAAAVAWTKLK